MESQKKPRKIGVTVISILLAVLIGVNIACSMYANVITQFFSKAVVDEVAVDAATAHGLDVIETIQSEGSVLLENRENALPLDLSNAREQKVNLFGWASTAPVYGGEGSGSGNEVGNVDLRQGLENAGFTINDELYQFYVDFDFSNSSDTVMGQFSHDYNIYEPSLDNYSDELIENAKNFSDVAIVSFARMGGEGSDLPMDMSEWGGSSDQHFLELSDNERAMLQMVEENFDKVIVLINSSNVMELGFLEDDDVDAALWIGGPGSTGMNAVGKLLSGEYNPSGRLTDTYIYDLFSNPAYYNFGKFIYSNSEYTAPGAFTGQPEQAYHYFVEYAEGIYVGYRYFETRWVDNNTGICDENAYQAVVQYPFGYGLSYTSFDQQMGDLEMNDGVISVDVTVTNTGTVAGKDVVELYYTAPYYIGGIEKSHVVLLDFEKTDLLQPGESQTITISFKDEDMASYDYQNAKAYVLDAGDYEIKLMSNAHDVIDSRTYTVDSTIVYDGDNSRSTDLVAATNLFDDVSGDVTYVSRADWEGTLPTERTQDKEASQEILDAMVDYSVPEDPSAEDIVIQDNGLKLEDMVGLDYNDPKWDLLLEQLSVEDMQTLIGYGGFATQVIDSVGKPYTVDLDGPAGINSLVRETNYSSNQYNSAVVIAATWNKDIARAMGESYGAEADAWGVSGLYAPAMNIHRFAFGGRNFEYYSEDGLLSGKIAANVVAGIQSQGVYCYMKHFVMNDQETKGGTSVSSGVVTWCNEQAMREIYLRPFELAVKEGGARGAMSAFNRLGTTWCGASTALMTNVLRNEWGFQGMVITDFDGYAYQDPDQGIRAGNDLMLTPVGDPPKDVSNAGKQAMRNACHNILYTIANSNALEIDYYGPTPYWLYALIALDVLAAAAAVVIYVRFFKKRKAWKALQIN